MFLLWCVLMSHNTCSRVKDFWVGAAVIEEVKYLPVGSSFETEKDALYLKRSG